MTTTFVQNTQINAQTSPKDVPYLLGTLAQDDSILFTKATLVAFLKTHGVEVGPNFSEFSRLPRYATFGTLVKSEAAPQPEAAPAAASTTSTAAQVDAPPRAAPAVPQAQATTAAANDAAAFQPSRGVTDAEGQAFRPTRRVRELIGGGSAQIASLFGGEDDSTSGAAPSPSAPSAPLSSRSSNDTGYTASNTQSSSAAKSSAFTPSTGVTDAEGQAFRPTRRVREPIGGGSEQIAGLFGGGGGDENYGSDSRRSPSRSPSTSSAPLTQTPQPTPPRQQRGLFIAIEGLDRAGKSTQLSRLHAHLGGEDRTTLLKFPDRTTPIGKLLHSYLTTTAKEQPLDDRAVHLLFAANRWEVASRIRREVEEEGRVVLADRYAWSGVAYSRAKASEIERRIEGWLVTDTVSSLAIAQGLPLPWLFSPEQGLPLPDVTLFLSLDPSIAAQRGGFGEERYEEPEMQRRVRESFAEVAKVVEASGAAWRVVDAGKGGVDVVWEDVWRTVSGVVEAPRGERELRSIAVAV